MWLIFLFVSFGEREVRFHWAYRFHFVPSLTAYDVSSSTKRFACLERLLNFIVVHVEFCKQFFFFSFVCCLISSSFFCWWFPFYVCYVCGNRWRKCWMKLDQSRQIFRLYFCIFCFSIFHKCIFIRILYKKMVQRRQWWNQDGRHNSSWFRSACLMTAIKR